MLPFGRTFHRSVNGSYSLLPRWSIPTGPRLRTREFCAHCMMRAWILSFHGDVFSCGAQRIRFSGFWKSKPRAPEVRSRSWNPPTFQEDPRVPTTLLMRHTPARLSELSTRLSATDL